MVNLTGGNKSRTLDVAREAGVSRTTASLVLNESPHAARISAETRTRVIAAARRLGYVPNPVGLALKRGYSDTLVLLAVAHDLADARARAIVSLSWAAAQRGISTTVRMSADEADALAALANVISYLPYGLLLLWDSPRFPTETVLELQEHGLPVIDLLPGESHGMTHVTSDRFQGFRLLTHHLISQGHRHIAAILNFNYRGKTSQPKLLGYRQALRDAGIEVEESLLEHTDGCSFAAGDAALRNLLARRPDTTALVCLNDPVAVGAVAAAQDMGLSVPGDFSVAGYGNHAEGNFFHPRLTTVVPDFNGIALAAVDKLRLMREQHERHPQSSYFPMELVIRESTGAVSR